MISLADICPKGCFKRWKK